MHHLQMYKFSINKRGISFPHFFVHTNKYILFMLLYIKNHNVYYILYINTYKYLYLMICALILRTLKFFFTFFFFYSYSFIINAMRSIIIIINMLHSIYVALICGKNYKLKGIPSLDFFPCGW